MIDQISNKDKDVIGDSIETQFTPRKTEVFQPFVNFSDNEAAEIEARLERNIEEYELVENAGRELSDLIAERVKNVKISIDPEDLNLKAAIRRIFNVDPTEVTFDQFKQCVDAQLDIISNQSRDLLANAQQQVAGSIAADGDISGLLNGDPPEASIVLPLAVGAFQKQMTQQMYMMMYPFMSKDFRGLEDCTIAHTPPLAVTGSSATGGPVVGTAIQTPPTTATAEARGAAYKAAVAAGKTAIDASVKAKG